MSLPANSPVIPPAGGELVGYSGTLTINNTNYIPQVANELVVYDQESYSFTSFMTRLGMTEDATNPTYQWQEIQYDEPNVNCETAISAASAGATQGSVVIDSLAVVVGNQYKEAITNQTFQIVFVDSQDTTAITSTCTIKKVPATAAIFAIPVNSFWMSLGNAMLEGGRFPEAIVRTPKRLSNTIFQMAAQVRITRLQEHLWMYYGSQWNLDLQNMQERVKRDLERRMILGDQYEQSESQTHDGIAVTGMARGSRGMLNSITQKRIAYNPPLTESTLDSVLATKTFGDVYGGGRVKFGYSGNLVFNDVASFVKNKFRKLDSAPQYGLTIHEYTSPVGNGTLYLIEERQFFGVPAFQNAMMIVDPARIRIMKVGPTLMQVSNSSPPDRSVKSIAVEVWAGLKGMYDRSHTLLSPYI